MRIGRLADTNDATHDGNRGPQVEADNGQQIRLAAEDGDEDRRADCYFRRYCHQANSHRMDAAACPLRCSGVWPSALNQWLSRAVGGAVYRVAG